jgi:hypothetical protein
MNNTILEILQDIETWNTQDIKTLVSLLQEYLQTERANQ